MRENNERNNGWEGEKVGEKKLIEKRKPRKRGSGLEKPGLRR